MDTNNASPQGAVVGLMRFIGGRARFGQAAEGVVMKVGRLDQQSPVPPANQDYAAARPTRDEGLPRNEFLQQLAREKRRSERSKAPLSVVVYHLGGSGAPTVGQTCRFLEALHAIKRETDVLGHLSDGSIAVLCPDTGERGIDAFMRKLQARAQDLPFEAVSATYPDALFEHLSDKAAAFPRTVLLNRDSLAAERNEYALKRCLDIIGAIGAIFLFAPVMIVISVVIAWTSRGPIIFKQTRLGRGGVPFTFYKFRSMTTDVNDDIHRAFVTSLISSSAAETSAEGKPQYYKLQSDPRVTRVGSFMRKSSIDELPQLFNVLKGDMSLVGPRPAIPYETAHYQSWHLRRIVTVRPGMTGLWQVQGRSKVSFNDMVRMDIRYIKECSMWLDLKILSKTILVVVRLSESS